LLRRIFGPKRKEVVGGSTRRHNEDLYNLNASSDIVRLIKSRRMTWTAHVAGMGDIRNAHKVLIGESEGKNHSEYLDLDGRIILE
jgi:hypothetical protein